MAHIDQLHFIGRIVPIMIQSDHTEIVEFGSYDVNGHIRALFTKFPGVQYTGIDLIPGPNVDVVCNASIYKHPVLIDVAISCECMEHNPDWQETIINMLNSLGPNGVAIFSFASRGRKEHGTHRSDPTKSPGTSALGWNYYQNLTSRSLESIVEKVPGRYNWAVATNLSHFDVYGVVSKGMVNFDMGVLIDAFSNNKKIRFITSRNALVEDASVFRRLKQRGKYFLETVLGGGIYQRSLLWLNRRR